MMIFSGLSTILTIIMFPETYAPVLLLRKVGIHLDRISIVPTYGLVLGKITSESYARGK